MSLIDRIKLFLCPQHVHYHYSLFTQKQQPPNLTLTPFSYNLGYYQPNPSPVEVMPNSTFPQNTQRHTSIQLVF